MRDDVSCIDARQLGRMRVLITKRDTLQVIQCEIIRNSTINDVS